MKFNQTLQRLYLGMQSPATAISINTANELVQELASQVIESVFMTEWLSQPSLKRLFECLPRQSIEQLK